MAETAEFQRLRAAFSSYAISISIADLDREDEPIIYANEGFVALTGYAVEEVIGRNCRFLQRGEQDPEARARLRAMLDNPDILTARAVMQNARKDGTPFENYVFMHQLPTRNGRNLAFASQFDVTRALASLSHDKIALSYPRELAGPLANYRGLRKSAAETKLRSVQLAAETLRTITNARLRHL
ncbi:PAS domain-containing protein [Parvularcula lutaonensis]|uniref:PAS domain-containing protein n=1 Tax=Parvularcula lutaonensis TaxID=491923 RepID=A0ABV7M9J1_9PROT|nr:PAS domain-containing protein [Parvularcula lutaonensis]GGY45473.1 hypothetical protein GCM10007148_13080 [Parvularcula lutaonensis]